MGSEVGGAIGGMAGDIGGAIGAIGGGIAGGIGGANAAGGLQLGMCFPAGTPVSTADGPRAIDDITTSDRVWAYDLVAREWKLQAVLETLQHQYEGDLVAISIQGETIEATGGHPFWVLEGQSLEQRSQPEHVPCAQGDVWEYRCVNPRTAITAGARPLRADRLCCPRSVGGRR